MFTALVKGVRGAIAASSSQRSVVEYAPLPVIRTSVDDDRGSQDILDGTIAPHAALIADERPLVKSLLPGQAPTLSQAATLRRVPAAVPWTTYMIALVEFGEFC